MARTSRDEFMRIMIDLADGGIDVHEQVRMQEVGTGKPLLDRDGEPIILDVVVFGDARVYVDRDDNDPQGVQDFIDFLHDLDEYLPAFIDALRDTIR